MTTLVLRFASCNSPQQNEEAFTLCPGSSLKVSEETWRAVCLLPAPRVKPPRNMLDARCALCFLLSSSLVAAAVETSASRLPHVQNYQVVRPQRLHAKQKRASQQDLYPSILQFTVPVEGKERVIHLEKNQRLLAQNYSETKYLENGTEVTSTPLYPDHCYYHGHIKGVEGSTASFSTCDGLSGYLRTKGQRYLMEPLKDSASDEHALYKYEELRLPMKGCGVVNKSEDSMEPRTEETFSNDHERSEFLKANRYIEMFVVADHSEYRQFGSFDAVRKRVFEAVNHINLLYKPLRTHVALIGLEVWSNGDKITVEKESGRTLNNILQWRKTHLLPRKQHDNIQFITHVDFTGDTIGLAQVSAMCTGGSGAINQDHQGNVHGVASTIAHEMGHNLGMNHDDNTCLCSSNSCIMSPVLSYTLPTEFSSCSHQHFQSFVLTHTASCLRDLPNRDEIVSKPICGNRFLEKGEECDCGNAEECLNPCCDAQTCRLHEGAQCAEGACCQECKVKAAGLLCRRAKDDCDLAEVCDGKSNDCPEDNFGFNGIACKGNTSFCYNGKCPRHQDQCVLMWGTGAQSGPGNCYQRNKQGDQFSFCRKTASGYEPCMSQDIMCGQLNCVGGNKKPPFKYGELGIGQATCRVILAGDGIKGLVQNGTKCGDNKMCVDSRCTAVKLAEDCSRKCPGRAVCNHLEECQFEVQDSSSGSSTLPSYAIVIIVLIVVLIITAVGIAAFVHRKHNRKTAATPRGQQPPTSGLTNLAFTDSSPATPQQSRLQARWKPMMVDPPLYVAASAPYPPPHQTMAPLVPPSKPVVPPGKPAALRAPPQPPGVKPPQPPGVKPLQPPLSKVLMPPSKPRK
ncbi:zinc metalloproteinase-disintegrin-like BjussuMP-1 isoform X2 [Scyliorhinus canicula]|uniref:zinc metalloproteinase-disintegrin-like BjussuMP-1 isoform X2 n=1 Tax=Scyliorhinus canicula TaxID=7830 RepID=UPI0018F2C924|nr:zinc metalloproteinase-disintegrin-like BjussuMP-1 isoform X2 [Scyliorhinus canicula]